MVKRLAMPLTDWVNVHAMANASDGQLLYRFARLGEQQAFSVLMKRHGSLVWGVCRRLLIRHHDAEDAFQATFIVLARKAATLRQPEQLAAWLHGVAQRTAWQISRQQKLSHAMEPLLDIPVADAQLATWKECRQIIDQAVSKLPASLRIVFLLSQYEEQTTLAIARKLGVPEGTVVSRLHRARKLLQGCLNRHGITSAAGAVTICWGLSLPESLAAASLKTMFTAVPSLLVVGLAQGVLSTMFWTKFAAVSAIALSLGVAGTGTVTLLAQGSSGKKSATSSIQDAQSGRQDRIKQLESQLLEARDRELTLRAELDSMKKRVEDVQMRLESEVQKERKLQAFLSDKMVAQEKEQLADREKMILRDKMELEKRRAMRLKDYTEARELLASEISELRKRMMEHERVMDEMMNRQAAIDIAREKTDVLKLSIEKVRAQLGDKHEKVQQLTSEYEKNRAEMQELLKQKIRMPANDDRELLQSQLKLREKLLLEVDEKLLRSKLKLD
ncbi:MAG: sigma-70 family RNA polymerase sigma factor [Planctomycetia bacterium]|nr:sigma-70 family RNA polymerase sigma factor [Planctomycetia bacterium]